MPLSGKTWAERGGTSLCGCFYFHLGDSAFGSGSIAVAVGTEPNFLTLVNIRAKWPGGG